MTDTRERTSKGAYGSVDRIPNSPGRCRKRFHDMRCRGGCCPVNRHVVREIVFNSSFKHPGIVRGDVCVRRPDPEWHIPPQEDSGLRGIPLKEDSGVCPPPPDLYIEMDEMDTDCHGLFRHMDAHTRHELARQFAHQVGAIVTAIHMAGWVHLDLKPSNILHKDGIFRLCDLGTMSPQKPGIEISLHCPSAFMNRNIMSPSGISHDNYSLAVSILYASTGKFESTPNEWLELFRESSELIPTEWRRFVGNALEGKMSVMPEFDDLTPMEVTGIARLLCDEVTPFYDITSKEIEKITLALYRVNVSIKYGVWVTRSFDREAKQCGTELCLAKEIYCRLRSTNTDDPEICAAFLTKQLTLQVCVCEEIESSIPMSIINSVVAATYNLAETLNILK